MLSFEGLPPDVTATLLPDPFMGTDGNAVLRLTATSTAAQSFTLLHHHPADPQGNGSVGPAIRTATSKLLVSTELRTRARRSSAPLCYRMRARGALARSSIPVVRVQCSDHLDRRECPPPA